MSFSPSFARECAAVVVLALFAGCEPKDGVKEFEQGKAAYELHDLKKAERLFDASLACAPQDVDRLLFLSRVKLDLGQLSEAKDLVARAVALAGGDTDVKLLAAQIAWHTKDYKSAANGFASVANDAALDAALRAQGFAGLGVVEETCGNHDFARIAFLRAILLDRRNAAAWYHLGLIYREHFEYLEAACDQFDAFVHLEAEASPRVQKVQRNLIPSLKDAIAHRTLERPGASQRNSAACATAIAKAEAEWKKGLFKAARQSYQAALTADPLSARAAQGLAQAWEKTDATANGQRKAFENYKLACALSPSAIPTFLTAGSLAMRLKQYAQAVEIYSRAVAASPKSLDALDGLIRALRQVGGKAKIAQAYQDYRDSIPVRKKR